jgi:predicted ATPase
LCHEHLHSVETLQGFIDGYVEGDGFRRNNRSASMIVSGNIPFLQEMAEIIGARFTPRQDGRSKLYVSDQWATRHGFPQEVHRTDLIESSWAPVRLVTLTGPGGIGKTRLGLQLAAELIDDFPDGVYFVDLAPIREPTLVISAIAQTLGMRGIGNQPLVTQLQQFLDDKRMLLLLDNFEQVLDAAPLLAELLATASRLKLLVTSREVLHLRGEKEMAVPPLALPDRAQLHPLDQLSQYAAVALFIQRALDARADFQITNANGAAVVEICARLDGLPLAIELAAARSKLFAPEARLARLSSRLELLTGGARDLPARQQTIRSTIAWSYDLLTEAEQTLFRRLGVFVGGCTLHAAEAVTTLNVQTFQRSNVLDGLAALVDKSLLRQVAGPDSTRSASTTLIGARLRRLEHDSAASHSASGQAVMKVTPLYVLADAGAGSAKYQRVPTALGKAGAECVRIPSARPAAVRGRK